MVQNYTYLKIIQEKNFKKDGSSLFHKREPGKLKDVVSYFFMSTVFIYEYNIMSDYLFGFI